ncbi:uncharacterized protein PV09_08756 [Verruconis gallopava]|uniref:NADH dehydrogenase [ubiquinone] iron-sulfur protein 4, mitochondrial n=1 Tax=Verruconis gallopava TaxID=253628 RepID=A0A0D1ZZX3_9PEZI|nr:uncharacterized protein PV09_08756 [Verruconis gallopava]KIV99579.1 hypothetical protein PV09_08756 [Verruconis gallopava]
MSLLHKSIGSRLLASSVRRASVRAFSTSSSRMADPAAEPPAERPDSTQMVSKESAGQAQPRHQPDYDVAVDYRTSAYSPIPKRVMDGSEPGETLPAAVLSGAPVDLQARTVRIYRPTKPATQSGTWHSAHWLMDWDPLPKGHRWENPLMGWQSSGDFMNGERISFKTKEDAIAFANKQGYEYYVQEPNERRFVPKAYANNFVHSPKKLKIIRTK